MADAEVPKIPDYTDFSTAPIVYFDGVAAHGTLNGAIQIELAARIMVPTPEGGVQIKFATSGRIRCSPTAAANLMAALDSAIKMLEQPKQSPAAAASKLN